MDNKKIEKAAVNRVRDLIQQCDTIDDKLDEDDKNILTDGVLDLYSSTDQTVDNLRAQIPVQVKGTTRPLVPNKHGVVKFTVRTEALRRYKEVFHGVLLFVVQVHESTRLGEEVFFAQLLPYDIDQALSRARNNQKKTSVRIKPFPTNPKEITRTVTAFNDDREKQMKAKVVAYDFKGDVRNLPEGITSVAVTSHLLKGEDITTLAGLENSYVYGKTMDGQLAVLWKIEDVAMFARGEEATVASGDFEMRTRLMVGDHLEGRYLEFEGVSMILRKNHRVKLNFDVKGPLRERYKTVSFIREFLRTGELVVNGKALFRVETGDDADLERCLDEDIEVYRPLVETLDTVGIAADWDPEDMSDKELSDLGLMHRLLVKGKPWTGRKITSPIIHFDIQGCGIYALVREREEGSYAFMRFDSDELRFSFPPPSGEQLEARGSFEPVPAVMALGKDDLQKIVNLDSDKLASQFDRFPVTTGNQTPLNQKLLEMLSAYDDGAKQPKVLLACAVVLARRLYEFDSKNQTYLLNLMQTILREREFDDSEKSLLRDVALDAPEQYTRAAAYALLGEQEMAQACLDRCSETERKQIEDYPISQFFEKA